MVMLKSFIPVVGTDSQIRSIEGPSSRNTIEAIEAIEAIDMRIGGSIEGYEETY